MTYTISQVAKALNIPTSTIRYYDKEGLLPTLARKESGYRLFSDTEIEMLELIECLKETGMTIKEIKDYAQLTRLGDDSLQERHKMFLEQKKALQARIDALQQSMALIDHKCWYYESAIAAGTEQIHFPIKMSLRNKEKFQALTAQSEDR